MGAFIYDKDIKTFTDKYNCDKLEVYTEKTLLKNFTKKEIEYVYEGIQKKEVVYFRKRGDKDNDYSDKSKKQMCVGIAKFYKDLVYIFAALANIIDADFNYEKDILCEPDSEDEFKCISLSNKQLILSELKNTFNIQKILKNITVLKGDEKIDTFSKGIGIGFNSLNKLFKTEYDFNKGHYKDIDYENENDFKDYKEFIKKTYNAYTIGYTEALINAKPKPYPKNITTVPFDIFWKDYLRHYKNNKNIPSPFRCLQFNRVTKKDLKQFNKEVLISDNFKKKYNEEFEKQQQNKKKIADELFESVKKIIVIENDKPKISNELTIESLENLKKTIREKILTFYIDGQNELLSNLIKQINEYKKYDKETDDADDDMPSQFFDKNMEKSTTSSDDYNRERRHIREKENELNNKMDMEKHERHREREELINKREKDRKELEERNKRYRESSEREKDKIKERLTRELDKTKEELNDLKHRNYREKYERLKRKMEENERSGDGYREKYERLKSKMEENDRSRDGYREKYERLKRKMEENERSGDGYREKYERAKKKLEEKERDGDGYREKYERAKKKLEENEEDLRKYKSRLNRIRSDMN